MKKKNKLRNWIIISLALIFLISGCKQKQEIIKVEAPTIDETKNKTEIKVIENQTDVKEDERISLPNCKYNISYLRKDECNCNGTWIKHEHMHGFCTPNKITTLVCRNIENYVIGGEIYIHFKPGTTLEEAEKIINKYGGRIMSYTCWFEKRTNPYIIAVVKEGREQEFINLVGNETIITSAYKHRLATTQ